jgi:hypothetical protein
VLAAQPPTAESDASGRPRRRSSWPILLAALCLSIPLHLALALWLSGILTAAPAPVRQAVLIDAALPGAEAAGPQEVDPGPREMPPSPMDLEPTTEAEVSWEQTSEPAAVQDATQSGDQTSLSTDAAGPVAPGAVSIGAGGGTGGVATSTFFGARGSGRRFAFILDKSGSMTNRGGGAVGPTKMDMALAELLRSVGSLPDFAQFRICLFDTSVQLFPDRGFAKARASELQRVQTWLQSAVASGGTTPQVAFEKVMGEPTPPDAIFFLTDGRIPTEDPAWIAQRVVVRGKTVPVHCIAFGDADAAQQLEPISKATGGQFRFVPLTGRRP